MANFCAVCHRKIKNHPHAGRPRVLCHRLKCKSIHMHNYMVDWWQEVKRGNRSLVKVREVNLDRYDFYGNNEAGIYFL
jgi:hypothetical protein